VDFAFSEEQEELRHGVRRFLAERSPEAEVRRLMATDEGYEPAVWEQMAEQLGLHGLAIPEAYGGSGFTYVELTVVFEEMGRALLCAPFFASVALAANLLLVSGDEGAKHDYLPGIAAGTTIATVALAEAAGRWDEAGIGLVAERSGGVGERSGGVGERSGGVAGAGGGVAGRAGAGVAGAGGGWALSGEKHYVLDGHVADLILVPARTRSGVSVFAVERGAAGLSATLVPTMDQTRKQARVAFERTPARLVGVEGAGWPAVSAMLDLGALSLAAEQVGGAQRVLEMAVEYAKARVQFGRPIGSFQAIKHRCADMLVEVESARSAAYYAGWAAAEGRDDLPAVASLAKSYCSEAYFHAAAENIQIHGGIGFTWEHPAHLYFKRAKSSELLFGDPAYHRELLAQRIGI
jgi:alkylation response protein AidB-like acyl-CoA dehydrogenase